MARKNAARSLWKGTLNLLHLRTSRHNRGPVTPDAAPVSTTAAVDPSLVATQPQIQIDPIAESAPEDGDQNTNREPQPEILAAAIHNEQESSHVSATPTKSRSSHGSSTEVHAHNTRTPSLQSLALQPKSRTSQVLRKINKFLRTYIPGFALLIDFIIKPLLNLLVFLGTASLVRHYFGLVPTNNISSGSLQRSATKEGDSIFTQDSNNSPLLLSNPQHLHSQSSKDATITTEKAVDQLITRRALPEAP